MTAQTSLETFHEIMTEGLISKLEKLVLGVLMFEPIRLTAGEVSAKLRIDRNTVSPRFAKLCRKGVLRTAGKRRCSISGRPGFTYEFTGQKPVKLVEPEKPEPCRVCHGTGKLQGSSHELADEIRNLPLSYANGPQTNLRVPLGGGKIVKEIS